MSNIIFGLVPTLLDICKFANARLNILRLLLLLVKYVFVHIIILVVKIFKILFYATGMNSSGKSISTINFVDDLLDENAVFGGGVIYISYHHQVFFLQTHLVVHNSKTGRPRDTNCISHRNEVMPEISKSPDVVPTSHVEATQRPLCPEQLYRYCSVYLFAGLGILLRIVIAESSSSIGTARFFGSSYFIPNLLGCFCLGFLSQIATIKGLRRIVSPCLTSGFCGSLTTLSSWQLRCSFRTTSKRLCI